MKEDLEKRAQNIAEWPYKFRHLVVFTGARISMESDLHDFGGPNGLWTQRDKELPPKSMSGAQDSVERNGGYRAIADLQNMTKFRCTRCGKKVDRLRKMANLRSGFLSPSIQKFDDELIHSGLSAE